MYNSNKKIEILRLLNKWCKEKDVLICEIDERYLALEALYASEFGPYIGPYVMGKHEFHLIVLPEGSLTRVILRHSVNCPCSNYIMRVKA